MFKLNYQNPIKLIQQVDDYYDNRYRLAEDVETIFEKMKSKLKILDKKLIQLTPLNYEISKRFINEVILFRAILKKTNCGYKSCKNYFIDCEFDCDAESHLAPESTKTFARADDQEVFSIGAVLHGRYRINLVIENYDWCKLKTYFGINLSTKYMYEKDKYDIIYESTRGGLSSEYNEYFAHMLIDDFRSNSSWVANKINKDFQYLNVRDD